MLAVIAWGVAVFAVAQYSILGATLVAWLLGVAVAMVFYSSTKLDRGDGMVEALTVSLGLAAAGVAGLLAGAVIALAGWQACRVWGWLLAYDGDAYCRVEWTPWLLLGLLVAEAPLLAVAWPELSRWVMPWRAARPPPRRKGGGSRSPRPPAR